MFTTRLLSSNFAKNLLKVPNANAVYGVRFNSTIAKSKNLNVCKSLQTPFSRINKSSITPLFIPSPFANGLRLYSSEQNATEENENVLKVLQKQADDHPEDGAIQLMYLQELNKQHKYEAVIERIKTKKLPPTHSVDLFREYVRALVNSRRYNTSDIRSDLSPFLGSNPGGSDANPLYVRMSENNLSLLRMLGSAVVFCVIVYLLFFRNGAMGDLFSSNYAPAETNIKITFKDVKGSDEAKEELTDIVEYLKNPIKFSRMNAKLPKGVLLTGPPGCGKTLLARAMAGEAGVPFFYVSGSEFEEMLVGVGARRVRNLFQKAKLSSPCIIFIDEIDAVGGRRENPNNKTNMTLNQLLVELDGFEQNTGVVVIAATNLVKVLDPALLRPGRFDRQVLVGLPGTTARREIIQLYLADRSNITKEEVEFLAESTAGFSGADIFNMVNSAAIVATKKNLRKITMRLLESARENVMMGPERKSLVISPDTKQNIAYHEAGHALTALHLPGDRQIVKATLVPRGNALGMVRYMLKNELLITRETLESQLAIAMAGRVAEEIVFGPAKITQGASSDFEQATKLAYEMVAKYGMSDKVGHIGYPDDHNLSQATKTQLEQEASLLLEKSYALAKDILKKNRNQLELLAKALLTYDTLSLSEIEQVINGKDIKEIKEKQRIEEELLRVKEEEELQVHQVTAPSPSDLKQKIKN